MREIAGRNGAQEAANHFCAGRAQFKVLVGIERLRLGVPASWQEQGIPWEEIVYHDAIECDEQARFMAIQDEYVRQYNEQMIRCLEGTHKCCPRGNTYDFESDIGLVGVDRHGRACLAIPLHDLPRGLDATLVDPLRSQVLRATVAEHLEEGCRVGVGDASPLALRGDAVYRLAVDGADLSPGDLYIGALRPAFRYFAKRDGYVRVDFDREKPDEAFRACTSTEGLHFTVWSGEPLTGMRRWHRYHPIGYEVGEWEGSCQEADYTAPAPPNEQQGG